MHVGLTAELAFSADLARHARNFRCKRAELIDHGVDGVLQLQDFSAYFNSNFARQVAGGHRGGNLGDVSDLVGQVAGHGIDAVRKILPGSSNALHHSLSAELAFGTNFASHTSYFAGERVELVHHDVDGVLELQNFAAHIHRDLARQIAVSDGGGDFCD